MGRRWLHCSLKCYSSVFQICGVGVDGAFLGVLTRLLACFPAYCSYPAYQPSADSKDSRTTPRFRVGSMFNRCRFEAFDIWGAVLTRPVMSWVFNPARCWVSPRTMPEVMAFTWGKVIFLPLQWRHNGRDGVSNHLRLDCVLNRLFRRRSKLRVIGLCEGN